MDIGKNIREAREKQSLLVSEVARRAGLTTAGVMAIESGRARNPSVDSVVKIARALGIEPGELLKEEPDPKVVRLPSTPLVDATPEEFDDLLQTSESAATTEAILRAIEAEESTLLEHMARRVSPKLDRARLYKMAATDRWVKLADKGRDPRYNQFKSVMEIAHEVAAGQEWLKDQASKEERPAAEDKAG